MSSTQKPKIALYWCASCGGCEEAVVDLAENILTVLNAAEIVFWPVALDAKRADVEKLRDGEIDASFINGAVRTSEQEEMVKLLRQKSKLVVAYGACAHLGGIPGLANLTTRQAILDYVYHDAPSVVDGNGARPQPVFIAPEGELELPEFYDAVRRLDQVILVDYYIPGCPPTPQLTLQGILRILKLWEALVVLPTQSVSTALQAMQEISRDPMMERGAVWAGDRALCHECPLNATKPEKLLVHEWKRVHQVLIEPDKCLLAQEIVCLGPVTRGGCEALCIKGNMPCTGCFGPLDHVRDYGGKALSAMSSIVDLQEPTDIARGLEGIPDPAGMFYRYSVPSSLLGRKKEGETA